MKKRKVLAIVLALVFAMTMFAGCGNSGGDGGAATPPPAEGTTPAPAPEEKPADDGKVWELNANFMFVEDNAPGAVQAMKNCEERSNGRLKFTPYWSNSLLNIREIPKGVADGLADVSPLPMNVYTDILPLNSAIASLPFLGYESRQQAWDIFNQLHEEFPEMDQELLSMGVTPVGYYPMAPYYLHMTHDKEIRVPSDTAGEKILTSKPQLSKFLTAQNAAPVDQNITEFYDSLEKGVATGIWNNYAILEGMKLVPLLKQHVNFGPVGSHLDFNAYIIRTSLLDELPDDLREIMIEEWTAAAKAQADSEQASADKMVKAAADQGNITIDLTPDEVKQWPDPLQSINEDSVAELSKSNPKAQEVYDKLKELIAK